MMIPIQFSVLALLVMLDGLITSYLVSAHGPAVEANPLMRALIETYGTAGMFALKGVMLALFCAVIVIAIRAAQTRLLRPGLFICNVLYASVVAWSLSMI